MNPLTTLVGMYIKDDAVLAGLVRTLYNVVVCAGFFLNFPFWCFRRIHLCYCRCLDIRTILAAF